MDRRTFIATLVGILTPLPAAEAQPAGRPARVGFLTPSSKLSFESGGRRSWTRSCAALGLQISRSSSPPSSS
jgi:hypothetical protein